MGGGVEELTALLRSDPVRLVTCRLAELLVGHDDDFDAAVLRAAFSRFVAFDRLGLTATSRFHTRARDTLLSEIRGRRSSAAVRQTLVIVVGTGRVSVTDDEHISVRVLAEAFRQVREVLTRGTLNRFRVVREQQSR